MPSKLSRGLLIFALLVIAVLSWQWIDDRDVEPQANTDTIEMAETQSDYYLEDFEIINIANSASSPGISGKNPPAGRHLRITGTSLSHHHIEGYSIIQSPTVRLRSADDVRWQARAATGTISADFDVLDLQGDVELTHNRSTPLANAPDSENQGRETSSNKGPVTVNTNSISINTSNRTISSNETVQVNGAGWQYNAKTMRAEIDQGTLSFTSGVEAQFANPNKR